MTTATPRRLLRLPAVQAKLGQIGRETVYRWVRDGKLPAPVRLSPGGRAVGWYEDELDSFLAARSSDRAGSVAAAPSDLSLSVPR